LKFVAGNPGGHYTINGYYYDIKFTYGEGSFLPHTEDIEIHLNEFTSYPSSDDCACGGTVMTPEHNFSGA
jgi:hypothetical protein